MSKTYLAIILLSTLALTLIGPTVSGVSLVQQAKAERSGQHGWSGPEYCSSPAVCYTDGGPGGLDNDGNHDDSSNGNGGNGGTIYVCSAAALVLCYANGGLGGNQNSQNSGSSFNGNGGNGGYIGCCKDIPNYDGCLTESVCNVNGGPGGDDNSQNSGVGFNGDGGYGGSISGCGYGDYCYSQGGYGGSGNKENSYGENGLGGVAAS
jgi:hypothetical protein